MGRVADQQLRDPSWVAHREHEGSDASPVVSDEVDVLHAENVEQPHGVRREVLRIVTVSRCVAPAEATQVRHDEPISPGELRYELAPAVPVLRPAMEQQDGLPGTGFGHVKTHPIDIDETMFDAGDPGEIIAYRVSHG